MASEYGLPVTPWKGKISKKLIGCPVKVGLPTECGHKYKPQIGIITHVEERLSPAEVLVFFPKWKDAMYLDDPASAQIYWVGKPADIVIKCQN